MRLTTLACVLLSITLLQAIARETIREGEQSGIPDRADVKKKMKELREAVPEGDKKKEVRENQEETDPVFYDSTTSPKEMEEKNNEDI